jgi:hypothetical protein
MIKERIWEIKQKLNDWDATILPRMRRTQARDFSPVLLGSLPTTPYRFSPLSFPRPAKPALFRARLVIQFLPPIGSLRCL